MGVIFRSKGYVEIREEDLNVFRNFTYELKFHFEKLASCWEKESTRQDMPERCVEEALKKAAMYKEIATQIDSLRYIDTYDEYMSRMSAYEGF